MKILLVNGSAYPRIGGVENSLRFIGRELLRAGHQVKIFCLQYSPDEPLRCVHEGIEIIRAPYKTSRWPHAQFQAQVKTSQRYISEIIDEYQPDAIWSRSASVGLGVRRSGYAGPLLQIYCTNARMNCRGLFFETKGLPFIRRLIFLCLWPSAFVVSSYFERELSRKSVAVALSENMRRQLLRDFHKDAATCYVIPPGVDTNMFSPDNGSKYLSEIEQRYGLRVGDKIVLYVGRLSSSKNIPLLIGAFSSLPKLSKLVIVGSGPEEEYLRSYANYTGLSDRIVFAGPQYDLLPGFYSISTVCVLPTTIESFGQVYLESLASGTPVVGFAEDGRRILTATEEIVQDGKTGAIVREISASALAEKINEIISLNAIEYNVMSQRAREDIRKRFTWLRFVEEALRLSVAGGSEGLRMINS